MKNWAQSSDGGFESLPIDENRMIATSPSSMKLENVPDFSQSGTFKRKAPLTQRITPKKPRELLIQRCVDALEKENAEQAIEDEHSTFGTSIGHQLRAIKMKSGKLHAATKKKINDAIFEAEMQLED